AMAANSLAFQCRTKAATVASGVSGTSGVWRVATTATTPPPARRAITAASTHHLRMVTVWRATPSRWWCPTVTAVADTDPWTAVLERLDDAAALTGLDPAIHRLLRVPRRCLEVAIPIRTDDARVEVFTGWRRHHGSA